MDLLLPGGFGHVARWVYLALAASFVVVAAVVCVALRRRGRLGVGRALVVVLGLFPLVYEALVHVELVREGFLRFEWPPAVVLPAAASIFLVHRLAMLPARMGGVRRSLVVTLVSASLLGAALAVAGPELGRPLDRMTLIVAVDRSRSLDLVPQAESRMSAELRVAERGMRDDDRIARLVFGAEAQIEDPPRPRSELPPPQRVEVGRDGTDLEAAVRRALAELPADSAGRVVLLSDGVQTRGDALAAAAAAVASDVPVDVIVLEQKKVPDVRVVTVRTPTRADEGEAMDLRVVTQSAVATDVEVRVKRDGEVIHKSRAHIAAGEDVLRLRETASAPGLHRYDVEVTALDPAADGSPEDNAGSAFVRVRGPSLALVIEGDPGKGAPLARALEASGFRVQETSTTGVPADVGGLAGYDLITLSDVRASDLATSQIDALASYTRDLGGGLLLLGGDRSFGPGGYARTPIEDVSPVAFDLKEEKRRASLAEVIAIDYSGSMAAQVGGQTKLALANEASARSASLLGHGDRLGVEHVDTSAAWTIPLGPVDDSVAVANKIRSVAVGGGGIYTDVALKEAYTALDREKVNLRHTLLFADGNDAEQIAGCRALVSAASARGITTSVISLGRGSDTPELEVLSKLGSGRFYLIDDATKLPAVFTQETILASKNAIKEEPFKLALGSPSAATRGIDFAAAPELRGYVVTVAKPRATVGLLGPEGDPLLATWAVGLGRAAAFTSDYKDRWGSAWLTWPGAAKLFGQVARDTARKGEDPRVRLESDASGGELHVRADVVGDDGRAQTFRRLTVHVAGPDGFSRDLPLEAISAGRYAATLPLSRPGTYVAAVKDEITGDAVGTTGAVLTAGEEMRPTGSDHVVLARVASITGGKVRDTLAGIFDDRGPRRFAYTPLTALVLLVAALAMLFGVAARRLGTPDWMLAAVTRVAGWRARTVADTRARQQAAIENEAAHARELARVNAALLATKRRAEGTRPGAGNIMSHAPSSPATPGAALPVPPAPPPAGHAPLEPSTAPPQRELSAAERLALRRRERK